MSWLDYIAHKYPGWMLFGMIIVGLALAEALGKWFQRGGK